MLSSWTVEASAASGALGLRALRKCSRSGFSDSRSRNLCSRSRSDSKQELSPALAFESQLLVLVVGLGSFGSFGHAGASEAFENNAIYFTGATWRSQAYLLTARSLLRA